MREDKQPEDICRECTVMHRVSMEWETGKGQCERCMHHRLISNRFTQKVLSESEAVSNQNEIHKLRQQIRKLKDIIAN